MLLARLEQFVSAELDIVWCLQREPQSGQSYYTAACIWALAMKIDSSQGDQALEYLQKALQHGFGRDRAEADDDLTNLRKHPRFRELIRAPGA